MKKNKNADYTPIDEQGVIENEFNWKLVREHDGLTKRSKDIAWLEWNEDGSFKEKRNTIDIGRSLIMSPLTICFTWHTTNVTEELEAKEDGSYIKFKTKNSIYILTKIQK